MRCQILYIYDYRENEMSWIPSTYLSTREVLEVRDVSSTEVASRTEEALGLCGQVVIIAWFTW